MSLTLLEVVNSYLDATDGIPVTSISNSTIEAQQVANIAKEVYEEVISEIPDWKFNTQFVQLEAVSDSARPNYLRIPDNASRMHETTFFYNTSETSKEEYTMLKYLPPHAFIRQANSIDTTQSNAVKITDFGGATYYIQDDKAPEFWTTFDDEYIVTDSYDKAVDSTLQASKTQAFMQVRKEFLVQDGFTIPLPEHFLPTYRNLVKARASEYLREEPLFSDATKGRAGLIKAKHDHFRVGDRNTNRSNKPRYGRRK
jgi:hypothetical protein